MHPATSVHVVDEILTMTTKGCANAPIAAPAALSVVVDRNSMPSMFYRSGDSHLITSQSIKLLNSLASLAFSSEGILSFRTLRRSARAHFLARPPSQSVISKAMATVREEPARITPFANHAESTINWCFILVSYSCCMPRRHGLCLCIWRTITVTSRVTPCSPLFTIQ